MIQVGKITQVIGPVVDVEFSGGELPPIYSALKITNPRIDDREENLIVEIAQHLGDEVVRCVAMDTSDGLVRGMKATYYGEQITIPVGRETLGRILNVVGKPVDVSGRSLVVSGILEATGSQDDHILFTSLATAQSILHKEGRISLAEVAALCSGCPIEEMVRQISVILPEANVMAIKQVVEGRMETLNQFRKASYGLSAIVVLVGVLVVLVTMMGSVRERTAEIGIFRAIGFRSSHIMKIILLEAGIVSVLAGVLGYLLGLGATKIALLFFAGGGHAGHGIALPVDPWLAGAALALAIVLGLSASYYPARLAARLDPCEALRAL